MMRVRLVITITAVTTIRGILDHRPQTEGLLDAISQHIRTHFSELEPDPEVPLVSVSVSDLPEKET